MYIYISIYMFISIYVDPCIGFKKYWYRKRLVFPFIISNFG